MIVHPEVGKWLIALGEKAFGMDPFGWRIAAAVVGALMVLVMCRLARRLTGSTALGLRRRAAAVLRRAALRALPAGAARHLRGVLPALRACTAWSPTATGTAPGWPGSCPRRIDDAASAWGRYAGCCSGPGCSPPGSASGSRSAPSGRRSTRWRRSACWSGCGAAARGAPSASGGRCCARRSSTASRRSCSSWSSPSSSTSPPGPAGWCNADEYEEHLSSTQYTQYTGQALRRQVVRVDDPTTTRVADRDRAGRLGPGEVVQSLRSLWYYHQDVYAFHTHFLNCSDHTYAVEAVRLAAAQPTGRRRRRRRHPARHPGLRRPARQRLPAPGAAARHPGDLVGRHRRAARSRW